MKSAGSGEAEEVLGSRGRVRLLKALMIAERSGSPLSTSKLKAMTRLKEQNLKRHLKPLLTYGWVEEVSTPEGKRYRLKADEKVEALKKLFKELGYL